MEVNFVKCIFGCICFHHSKFMAVFFWFVQTLLLDSAAYKTLLAWLSMLSLDTASVKTCESDPKASPHGKAPDEHSSANMMPPYF